ncbi:hypothetical protein V7R84_08520 [Arachnia propionica]|uniref:hypothetical protein n=1 Tax=Arachnia propionica TaxID=1750 RepID=UPI0030D54E8F
MAEGKLIFREASVQALEDAFAKRAAGLREGISGMGAEVRSEVAAWDSGTESRQAQEQKAAQVEKRAESLVQAMERAAAVMKEIHSLASRVETENAAILD